MVHAHGMRTPFEGVAPFADSGEPRSLAVRLAADDGQAWLVPAEWQK
jgi:hypothetical protein